MCWRKWWDLGWRPLIIYSSDLRMTTQLAPEQDTGRGLVCRSTRMGGSVMASESIPENVTMWRRNLFQSSSRGWYCMWMETLQWGMADEMPQMPAQVIALTH